MADDKLLASQALYEILELLKKCDPKDIPNIIRGVAAFYGVVTTKDYR